MTVKSFADEFALSCCEEPTIIKGCDVFIKLRESKDLHQMIESGSEVRISKLILRDVFGRQLKHDVGNMGSNSSIYHWGIELVCFLFR